MKQDTINKITATIKKYYPSIQFNYIFFPEQYKGYHIWQSQLSAIEVYQNDIPVPRTKDYQLVWIVYVNGGVAENIGDVGWTDAQTQVGIRQDSKEPSWVDDDSNMLSSETKKLMESLASELLDIVCSDES
ncbi:hypothetical protein NDI37_10170 [Funiculus sociatus GB2-A5]|uniref:Uncharacterized protein n=1 Tax=Funiculus sociatus GB2-A5 TaxID=2933946 RepID=A0ABV0JNZ4_9CYAN|nr:MULTISPECIES: hypothetical protein [unclassified Trichocoleus]MBD1907860.1 hypothetical protein [Trichocoleus sp. FACHB-832]MBD2064038.1 hypothetical protein [Trichocoleus sp. FACHB-6]